MPTDLALHTYGLPADQAPALLLLHGATDSGPCWADAIERWQDRFHIVAPDARGHGESPRLRPDQADRDTNDVMADDAVDIITDLNGASGRPVLVAGHSMGARVGALAAARVPELVAALVLEDPPWWMPEDGPSPWHRDQADQDRTEPEQVDVEQLIANQRASTKWPESELRPWAQAKVQVDRTMMGRRHGRPPAPWTPTARALDSGPHPVPTLLVTGDGNVLVGQQSRDRLAEVAPGIEVVVIEQANHCVRRDAGDRFHAVVDPFLTSHAPAG